MSDVIWASGVRRQAVGIIKFIQSDRILIKRTGNLDYIIPYSEEVSG